jgi:hypothetical protein
LPVVSEENMENISIADVPADILIERKREEGRRKERERGRGRERERGGGE